MRSSTVFTFGLLCALPVFSAPLGERAEVSGDWVEIGGSARRGLPGGEHRESGEDHRDHYNQGQAPGRFAGPNSMQQGQRPSKNNFPSHQQNNNHRLPEAASHVSQQRDGQNSKLQRPGEDREWQHDRQDHGKNEVNHHGGSHGSRPGEHPREQEFQKLHGGGHHQGKSEINHGKPQGGHPQEKQQSPQQGVPQPQQGKPQGVPSGQGVPQGGNQEGQQQTPKKEAPQQGTPQQGNTPTGTQSGAAPAGSPASEDGKSQGTPQANEKRMSKNDEIFQWQNQWGQPQGGPKGTTRVSSTILEHRPISTGGFHGDHSSHGLHGNHNNHTRPAFREGTTVLPHHKSHHNQTDSEGKPAGQELHHQTPQEKTPKNLEPVMHTMDKVQQKREDTVDNNEANQQGGPKSSHVSSTTYTPGPHSGQFSHGTPGKIWQDHLPIVDKTSYGISRTFGSKTQKRDAHHNEEHEQVVGGSSRSPDFDGGRSDDSGASSGVRRPASHPNSLTSGRRPSGNSQTSSGEHRSLEQEVKREAKAEAQPVRELGHGPVQFTKPAPFANLRVPIINKTPTFLLGEEKTQA